MSDLISRQVAIDKINERQRKLIYCFGFENDVVKIMDIAKSIIIAIPSAQPERKTGWWIEGRDERFVKCSECGMESTKNALMGIALFGEKEPHFCPNCGSYNGGEQNEID